MRAAVLAAGLLFATAPAFAADPVNGEWLTPYGKSKVRIGACPGRPSYICGVVSWLPAARAKDLDRRNRDAALKTRPMLGVSRVLGFKPIAPGEWTGGKLYDPGSGRTFDGEISANPDGTLTVKECVMMFCQAQTWTRG